MGYSHSGSGLYVLSSFLRDARCFVFSFDMRFRLGTFPPRGTVGCATFPFRVGFRLLSRPPRHDGRLREGFDFGFPCLRACVLLHFVFLRLATPTPTIRGRVLTVVGLAIAPSSSRSPRHTGGTRQVFDGWFVLYVVCVSFNNVSSRFSWLHSQAVQRCGSGF